MSRRAAILALLLCLVCVAFSSPAAAGRRTDQMTSGKTDGRELLAVLQNVLEKLQTRRLSALERRHSQLPSCEVGALCSVKKGPRFGQLCDCPKASKCNFFFLKCL
ncbi:cocaine- and amphetamine-regulated transcript protein-like [Myripristis murdjan]|uniref:cocaine- and amphetamine-regulated transcript protein-like n=1 Tax=Myripristis murdjan TaxID=586833 RepID=UPI001175FB8E|nr:cocaine- and amphetamine-regulated transcript protein-like [Myripristis murdjan]